MREISEPGNEIHVRENNLSAGRRIAGVIVSPGEAMDDIAARPAFWLPVILIALSQLVLLLARFPLYAQTVREQTEIAFQQMEGPALPEGALEQFTNIGIYGGLAATPFTGIISWLIIALCFFLLLKLFKGKGSYKQYLAVTGYAYIVMSIYMLLSLITSYFTGQLNLDASLANVSRLIAPDLYGTYLYGVLRGIDLFTVWYFVLMGIGASAVSKVSAGKVYLVTAILFMATVFIGASGYSYL